MIILFILLVDVQAVVLNLRCEGEESDLEDVMKVINDFLKKKWLKAVPSLEDPYTLGIISTFYKEDK